MNRPNRIELPKQELKSRIDSGELILCNTDPLIAVKSVVDPSAFAGSSWQAYIESPAQVLG
jgi:hypothetical protein